MLETWSPHYLSFSQPTVGGQTNPPIPLMIFGIRAHSEPQYCGLRVFFPDIAVLEVFIRVSNSKVSHIVRRKRAGRTLMQFGSVQPFISSNSSITSKLAYKPHEISDSNTLFLLCALPSSFPPHSKTLLPQPPRPDRTTSSPPRPAPTVCARSAA